MPLQIAISPVDQPGSQWIMGPANDPSTYETLAQILQAELSNDDEGQALIIKRIEMSQEEADALPEFDGW